MRVNTRIKGTEDFKRVESAALFTRVCARVHVFITLGTGFTTCSASKKLYKMYVSFKIKDVKLKRLLLYFLELFQLSMRGLVKIADKAK